MKKKIKIKKLFGKMCVIKDKECKYCKLDLDNKHLICMRCDIPLHHQVYECECGVAHTLTNNGRYCIDCQVRFINPQKVDIINYINYNYDNRTIN